MIPLTHSLWPFSGPEVQLLRMTPLTRRWDPIDARWRWGCCSRAATNPKCSARMKRTSKGARNRCPTATSHPTRRDLAQTAQTPEVMRKGTLERERTRDCRRGKRCDLKRSYQLFSNFTNSLFIYVYMYTYYPWISLQNFESKVRLSWLQAHPRRDLLRALAVPRFSKQGHEMSGQELGHGITIAIGYRWL